MKKLLIFLFIGLNFGLIQAQEKSKESQKEVINKVMQQWHSAAANANFEKYFSLMTNDGVFIGTAATENWQNQEFKNYAKPHFDKGKAWNFTTIERNIYISNSDNTAWFDELLKTQMGLCRGSGVLVNEDGEWKIKHYVLSIVIPNDNVAEVTQIKKEYDSTFIAKHKPYNLENQYKN